MPSFSNLFALSSVAALIISSGVTPVTALSISPALNVRRHASLARHSKVVRPKRDGGKSCILRARPDTNAPAAPSSDDTNAPAPSSDDSDANSDQNGGDPNANSAPAPSNGDPNANSAPPPSNSDNNSAPPPPPSNSNSSPPPSNNNGVSTTNGNGSGGGSNPKRGAAWPNGPDDLPKWPGLAWLYTWSPDLPPNCHDLGIDCVPMLWGWNQLDEFKQVTSQPGYATTALGPNEPDMTNNGDLSSGIDPDSCADLWAQGMEPLKAQGYRLGAPTTTSSPNGKVWMQNFLNACPNHGGCTIDFYPLHWYDVGFDKFQAYVTDWHNTFGKNVWVTEYACQNFNGGDQCTDAQVWDLLEKSIAWMEQTPWIERYSWFGMMHDMVNVNPDNQLMADSGYPNDKGNYYLTN